MSAVCRIIHLHGGPSDGLRLAWQDYEGETLEIAAIPSKALPEYDYIYVPRTSGAIKMRLHQVTDFARPRMAQRKLWWHVWSACRAWLLTPCSYPLDIRAYHNPARTQETLAKQ